MADIPKYAIQYMKYKWEFLRRNRKYIDEWKQLQSVVEEKYGGHKPFPWKEEDDFLKRWRIFEAVSPEISSEHIPGSLYELFYLPEKLLRDGPIKAPESWNNGDDGALGKIQVTVDLNYSKRRLLQEFKALLDEWKDRSDRNYKRVLYSRLCEEKGIKTFPINDDLMSEVEESHRKYLRQRKRKYQKKYHFDNFDLYLQVYDQKKEGKSWREIASNLGLNSIQTARNHYRAACELVEKGIEFHVK